MTRNHTIDILKGLGIIFVVVVHSRCPNFYLSSNAFYYHLDWKVIGCHPVVLPVRDHWFWIIYSLTSLILSLAMTKVIKKLPFRL